MPLRWNAREQCALGGHVLKWIAIAGPTAAVVGSACALFLWALDWATATRFHYPWLLFLLPVAGIAISLLYGWLGKAAEGGNNLIVEQIHDPDGGVPARIAPLILVSTVITHLFGGSAGREGTAVQMGGSIASTVGKWLKLSSADVRIVLMTGIAAGFGGVFGTPLAGAVFAMEVLAMGKISYEAIVPCLMAALIGDWSCTAWGIHHTQYAIAALPHGFEWSLMAKVALAGIAFGLVSSLFAEMAHGLQWVFKHTISVPYLRPVVGAGVVIGLTYILGTRDYLGLGVRSDDPSAVTILSAFTPGGAHAWSWWWKILFTAVTLSSGFKGGEVTPLFFIGATLGNILAVGLGVPVDLLAGLGFVAVFAGATNTPLACTLMGIELFGSGPMIYIATACFLAYLFSGHSGIYLSQRIGTPKIESSAVPVDAPLRLVRELQPELTESLVSPLKIASTARDRRNPAQENTAVPHRHRITASEMGQLRIYIAAGERRKSKGIRRLFPARPVYQEIIDAAKADGLLNAVAHPTHYGFSGKGQVQADVMETPNRALNMCVEIVGQRQELDLFVRRHGSVLKGRVVIYKVIEHWKVCASEEEDATVLAG